MSNIIEHLIRDSMRVVQDPIAIDVIEDHNKWFLGKSLDDVDNDYVHEGDTMCVLLQETLYQMRRLTRGPSSNATDGATSLTLINEDYEDKKRVRDSETPKNELSDFKAFEFLNILD